MQKKITKTKNYVGKDIVISGGNGGTRQPTKRKITFKKGITTIHIPLGFVMELPDGSYCVNPRRDIAKFRAENEYSKRAKLEYHVDFNNSGMREIILRK